jgi:dTDP-glucose 4,6-dehydratase
MAPRRAVVTGGCGFLGSHLCERLVDDGVDVVCVDNLLTGDAANVAALVSRPGFTIVDADIADGIDVDGDIDLVLHFASPASPLDYARLPIETMRAGSLGTMNALELASANDARFVFASTSEVYGDPLEHPQREEYWGNVNPVGPRSVYDEAKRFSEALTTGYRTQRRLDTGIVRIFNTYGPRMRADDGRVVPAFIGQALTGRPLTVAGDGMQTRSLCYVDDTVSGVLAMAESAHAGPINIGNPDELTILELAELVVRLTSSRSPIEFVELPVDDPRTRCPDIARARELLGWEPQTPVADGLKLTAEWFASRDGAS